jgi:LAS superfamily LD-carboxypeptidase LdcB
MATPPKQGEEQTENKVEGSTPQLDRLEKLANTAATAAQAKQWRARQNGLREQGEPSEVRNLTQDAEARAQAEAAMRLMGAAKPRGKPRGRW